MKIALFSSKDKSNNTNVPSAAIVLGPFMVNGIDMVNI